MLRHLHLGNLVLALLSIIPRHTEGKLALALQAGFAKAQSPAVRPGHRCRFDLRAEQPQRGLRKHLVRCVPRREELVPPVVDKPRFDVALDKRLAAAQPLEELNVGAESDDLVLA